MSTYAMDVQTDQQTMEYLLGLAEAGRELVAGLKAVPVAYSPRTDTDELPFVDLSSGNRYPVRRVYASTAVLPGNKGVV